MGYVEAASYYDQLMSYPVRLPVIDMMILSGP
jgi:hypothetical protein